MAVGLGGASLITAAATGIVALEKHSDLAPLCSKDGVCPAGQQGLVNSFHTFENASTYSLAAGTLLAITGVVLVVRSVGEPQHPAAWIAPTLGVGTVGLEGRFR